MISTPHDLDLGDLSTKLRVIELSCEIVERRLTRLQHTPPETPELVPVVLGEMASLGIEHSRLCAQRAEVERELAIAAGICEPSDAPN